jgi:hypothetical protein
MMVLLMPSLVANSTSTETGPRLQGPGSRSLGGALLAPVVAAVHGVVLAVDLPEPVLALARAVVLALALLAPVFALLWGIFRSPLHLLLQNP